MTCRSCGFENMKRSTVCARCGARLAWDGPVRKRDFQPPRRTFWGAVWLRVQEAAGWRGPMRWALDALGTLGRVPNDRRLKGFASVVPGLGQILDRRHVRGIAFFAAWLAIFAMARHVPTESLVQVWRNGRLTRTIQLVPALSVVLPALLCLMHGAAAIDAVRPGDFCRTRGEVGIVALFILLLVILLYGGVYYYYS